MKNSFLMITMVMAFITTTSAQVNPNAIGIRGGGGFGGDYGGEISYQKGLGEANRLELDFGYRNRKYKFNGNGNSWYYRHFSVSGIYHWVWNLKDGLNWFIGPGAQLGFYDDYYDNNSGISLAIGGQIGLEYDFNQHGVPLLLGLDARPMWDFVGYYSGFGGGAAFSLRYTF
jgi:hypothetical protein